MKYEEVANNICGYPWKISDFEGGLGIAIMISFLEGVPPFAVDMAKHIEIDEKTLIPILDRMMKTGLFSKGFNAKNDQELLGNNYNVPKKNILKGWTRISAYRSSWCWIAGIASDKTNRNFPKNK